ncbi:MAG: right-handed parallel beta-helix repeat-containing protein, partial [Bacteroidales bacterium]|nr:right-handed parallel beta-helix repeat-containing protein [Bacteroidales bacterium]
INSVVWGNKYNSSNSNLYTYYSNGLTVTNSAIPATTYSTGDNINLSYNNTGTGNVPMFTHPSTEAGATCYDGDWSLQDGSILIDKGSLVGIELPEKDLAGLNRIVSATVDIGAYERPFQSSLNPDANNRLYVRTEACGLGDGSSWENATNDLQLAVNEANRISPIPTVWVAEGTYTGSEETDYAYYLQAGVMVYGGFAATETELSQRDLSSHVTILDGGDARGVLGQTAEFADGLESVWDGFTIQHGRRAGNGAGAYLMKNGILSNCVIKDNVCDESNRGGGVYVVKGTLVNCLISNNTAYRGSGVYADNAYIVGCIITNNSNNNYSYGAVSGGASTFVNCDIVKNLGYGVASITNSRFTNCVIWGNSYSSQLSDISTDTKMMYCAVQGGRTGTGNINLSASNSGDQAGNYPMFVDPENGNWNLQQGSALINAGISENLELPEKDIMGNPRIQNGIIDLGACESDIDDMPIAPDANNIIYVSANGTGDGSSWADATSDWHLAVTRAACFSPKATVWVKAGTYSLASELIVVEGVNVYGGFAGTETEISQRNMKLNPTIVSGPGDHSVNRRMLMQNDAFTEETMTVWDGFTFENGYYSITNYSTNGIIQLNSYTVLSNCIVRNMDSDISVYAGSNCGLVNCLIANNTGKIYFRQDNVMLNCTYVNNGNLIDSYSNSLDVVNTVIWGNRDSSGNLKTLNVTNNVYYCAIEGGCEGYGNLALASGNDDNVAYSPGFVNPEAGDYSLKNTSVLVGRGMGDLVVEFPYDITGSARLKQGAVDMGAYESDYTPYLNIVPSDAGIIYVTTSGSGTKDGSSWANATPYLQFAISQAASMWSVPQVWVAEGTYYGSNAYLNNAYQTAKGVSVYGGFAGNETSLTDRNYRAHETVLDGQNQKRVLYQPQGYTESEQTEWNGFTLKNGYIQDNGSAAWFGEYFTLRNCKVTNCHTVGTAAIYKYYGGSGINGHIENCEICNNTAEGTVSAIYGYYLGVVNCLVANNTATTSYGGYAVNLLSSDFVNSTVVNNNLVSANASGSDACGVYFSSGNFKNNIVWGNKLNGEYCINASLYGTVENNAVEGFTGNGNNISLHHENAGVGMYPNFVSPSAGAGAEYTGGDWTLSEGSICINKGVGVTVPELDLAGNQRVQQGTIDLGAYESPYSQSFNIVPDANNVIYVKTDGTGDGSSWTNATSELLYALNVASRMSVKPQIWVAKGTYTSDGDSYAFPMFDGVRVYGGFAGNEAFGIDIETRNIKANKTILDGENQRTVLFRIGTGYESATIWDGFTIVNGTSPNYQNGGGVYLQRATLSNCEVTNCTTNSYGGGVYANDNAVILNCNVSNNSSSQYGGGVYLYNSSRLTNCVVAGNIASYGGGVYLYSSSILNSRISGNSALTYGGGVYYYYNTGSITNTTIVNNSGSGVYCNNSGLTISNSVLWGNVNNSEPSQIAVYNYNPTVRFSAIQGGLSYGTSNIVLEAENDGTTGNFTRFVDPEHDVYDIEENSSLKNVGSNNYASGIDLAGHTRIMDGTVDMGAFEQYCLGYRYVSKTIEQGATYQFYDRLLSETGRYEKRWANTSTCDSLVVLDLQIGGTVYYVTANGAGNKDGSSWANASDNLIEMMNQVSQAAAFSSIQIWVAEGTYSGNASGVSFPMMGGVKVYGGFAGNETSFAERDIESHPTVLMGNAGQYFTSSSASYPCVEGNKGLWDGFTMRTGRQIQLNAFTELQHCVIEVPVSISNATLENCEFNNVVSPSNDASLSATSANIRNCLFRNINTDRNMITASNSTFHGCVFESNATSASYYPMFNMTGSSIDSCTFHHNNSAGLFLKLNNTDLTYSLIYNNTGRTSSSSDLAGMIISAKNGSLISHCTVVNNRSNYSGTIYPNSYENLEDNWSNNFMQAGYTTIGLKQSTLENSIVWGNVQNLFENNIISKDMASEINYCAIQNSAYNGIGNIALAQDNDADLFSPHFVNPSASAGHLNQDEGVDWSLNTSSICLKQGNEGCDMGAVASDASAVIALNPTDGVIYVDASLNNPGDGSSWTNATPYLQYAVSRANTFTPVAQIWVKEGNYHGDGIATNNAFTMIE